MTMTRRWFLSLHRRLRGQQFIQGNARGRDEHGREWAYRFFPLGPIVLKVEWQIA